MPKKAIIITIGNEILSGDVLDENSHWVAKKLFHFGIDLEYIFVIPDKIVIIKKYLNEYKDQVDFLITLGGMGPTPDDVTKDAIAEVFGVNLEKNAQVVDLINSYYADQISEEKLLMSIFPEKAIPILTSKKDWAVGMINKNVFSFPGTPWLMRDAFGTIEDYFKDLEHIFKTKINVNCEETIFADIMVEMGNKYKSVDIGSYPSNKNFKDVKLIFKSRDSQELKNCRDEFIQLLQKKHSTLEIS